MINPPTSKRRQRLLLEIEQGIKQANREVIHDYIPPVTAENIMPFAVSVARLRAQYLKKAYQFAEKEHGGALTEAEVTSLRKHQEKYEAARDAFDALSTAIQRGYVKIKG
ncbi:MAG: hypothetical protein V3R66_02310 [Rhodospirillales bacterium]